MSIKKHIMQVLTVAGDGTGDKNLNGDYSAAPIIAHYKNNNPNHNVEITRTIIKIQDSGAFDADKYGNNITLVKGLRFYKYDNLGTVIEELTAYPLLSSGDMAGHCHDVTPHVFGTGDEVLSVRWTFAKSGAPIFLSSGESIGVVLNDDFTGLVDHKFIVQGTKMASN